MQDESLISLVRRQQRLGCLFDALLAEACVVLHLKRLQHAPVHRCPSHPSKEHRLSSGVAAPQVKFRQRRETLLTDLNLHGGGHRFSPP